MQELLKKIKQTVEGYEVKNLYFKSLDNIIVGQVKDPVWGNEKLYDGYITVTWTVKGVITHTFKERNGNMTRNDLTLKMPIE